MKILVTGATGFIGKYVIKELLKYNHIKIIATSIMSQKEISNYKWCDQVEYITCDINETKENFFDFFHKPDLMIHLSWENLPNYGELFHFEKNLFSNYFFIKNMITNGLKRIAVTGTCFEYGNINGCLSEDIETKPNNSYGLAKDTLRKFIEELNKKITFDFYWIRIFYLYGKGQNPNSLLSQLDKSISNNEKIFNMSCGEQIRDYLPVQKVAENIVNISLQNKIKGVINCCSNRSISVRKIVENRIKEKKSKIKLNLGFYSYSKFEPFAFWGDDTKLNKIIR